MRHIKNNQFTNNLFMVYELYASYLDVTSSFVFQFLRYSLAWVRGGGALFCLKGKQQWLGWVVYATQGITRHFSCHQCQINNYNLSKSVARVIKCITVTVTHGTDVDMAYFKSIAVQVSSFNSMCRHDNVLLYSMLVQVWSSSIHSSVWGNTTDSDLTFFGHIAVLCVTLWTWCETPGEGGVGLSHSPAGRWRLLSVLKGDHRVHFVDVVRAIPENSREVVCVGRVVHLYLVAESPVLGERVYLSFIVNHLKGQQVCTWIKSDSADTLTSCRLSCSSNHRWKKSYSHVRWRCPAGLWSCSPYWDWVRYKLTLQ